MSARTLDTNIFTGKQRPIEERIAALMGRSAYRDIRDGFAGGGRLAITDQDVAAAIGGAAATVGRIALLALETYYGSTAMHQHALVRAWEEKERKQGDTRERIVLTRFSGALAVQQAAGGRVASAAYTEYAYLLFSRRELLEYRVREAAAWLDELRTAALRAMKVQLFQDHIDGTRKAG
jgi:hypothetical protein